MTTITHSKTDYADQLTVEVDLSRHIASMRLAQSTGHGRTAGLAIAIASLKDAGTKPAVKRECLSSRDKFFRDLYNHKTDEQKVESLRNEFDEESNGIKRVLRQIGFEQLELEDRTTRQNPRAYNLSLLEK